MSNNTVIKLTNLKKIFRYFKKDYMVFYWLFTRKGYTKEFRVLDGINLEIKKGEVVGILGKNGAGKSTILKIISGIYFPTSGKVEVNGTIASLIELGAGFNKELTGRENIYLKGTLLGLSKEYIDNHIDAMIEFADIGEYIDMPLGTYSSGMSARLGFALAVNADPDILIIDEVFAVGDKNFQKKSRAKTEELLQSGKTVLFVSHSESLISEFCDRVVYLKNGKVVYDGNVERGLATYHADNLNLPHEPLVMFVEDEVIKDESSLNPKIRIRLEYGIGAGKQLIKDDNFNNFELAISKYSSKDNQVIEQGFADFEVEKIDSSIVDIYLNIEDIIDTGQITINFNHKLFNDSNKYVNTIYLEQNDNKDIDDHEIYIKNVKDNFVYEMKTKR